MRIIFQRKGKINWIQMFLIAICKQISIFSLFLSRLVQTVVIDPYYTLSFAKNKGPCQCKALKKRFHSVPKNLFGLRLSHNPRSGSTTGCIPTQSIASTPR